MAICELAMTCKISYDSAQNFILAKYNGFVNFEALKQSIISIIGEVAKKDCKRVICDFSKSTLSLTTIEMIMIENVVDKTAKDIGFFPPSLKRALIRKDIEINKQNYDFYIAYSSNRGHQIEVFNNIDNATNWLTET